MTFVLILLLFLEQLLVFWFIIRTKREIVFILVGIFCVSWWRNETVAIGYTEGMLFRHQLTRSLSQGNINLIVSSLIHCLVLCLIIHMILGFALVSRLKTLSIQWWINLFELLMCRWLIVLFRINRLHQRILHPLWTWSMLPLWAHS